MAQQLVSNTKNSRYVRVQNWSDSTLSMCIPKVYADNLQIKKHDTLRVFQEGDILLVRKVLERLSEK